MVNLIRFFCDSIINLVEQEFGGMGPYDSSRIVYDSFKVNCMEKKLV